MNGFDGMVKRLRKNVPRRSAVVRWLITTAERRGTFFRTLIGLRLPRRRSKLSDYCFTWVTSQVVALRMHATDGMIGCALRFPRTRRKFGELSFRHIRLKTERKPQPSRSAYSLTLIAESLGKSAIGFQKSH